MSVQTQLFLLLTGGATDAGARVFPMTAPDSTVRPYVIFQRVSTSSENVLYGATGLANTRMQIDVYSDTYAGAQALAVQIDTLMNGWIVPNTSVLEQDIYEDPVKLYRVSMDYSIWHDW